MSLFDNEFYFVFSRGVRRVRSRHLPINFMFLLYRAAPGAPAAPPLGCE